MSVQYPRRLSGWLNLLPLELQGGDHWDDGKIVESVEPVESPSHCAILFEGGGDIIWPLEAPRRIYRPGVFDYDDQ